MEETTNINAASTQAAQQQNPAPTPTSAAKEGTPKREYSQAELDEMFADRAKQAENSTLKRILKKFGAASEAELDAKAADAEDARKRKQDEMTDAQKAQAELQTVVQQKADLEAKVQSLLEARKSDLIESAIRTEATKLKANNVRTVLSYILVNHKDAMQASIDEDGKIDEKKITALLGKVKEEDATLFTPVIQGAGSPSNAGGRATLDLGAEALKRASATNQRIIRGG